MDGKEEFAELASLLSNLEYRLLVVHTSIMELSSFTSDSSNSISWKIVFLDPKHLYGQSFQSLVPLRTPEAWFALVSLVILFYYCPTQYSYIIWNTIINKSKRHGDAWPSCMWNMCRAYQVPIVYNTKIEKLLQYLNWYTSFHCYYLRLFRWIDGLNGGGTVVT